MPIRTWMIYGAYGYSGRLIAERAHAEGLAPVLSGRDADKTRAVADELGLEYRSFALDDTQSIARNLGDIDAIVHCAGPFSATSAAMIEGCLLANTHYFDITGEIRVFEHAHSTKIDTAAKEAGIVVCPGVGFDVVPTDCVAKTLADALPGAVQLDLGFHGNMSVSPGTAKTMVESLGDGTNARRDGKLVGIPLQVRDIDYGRGMRRSANVPWGDISTAFYTTGISNITVYWPTGDSVIQALRFADVMRPVLGLGALQFLLKQLIDWNVQGPSQAQRDRQSVSVWGEASDAEGRTICARMTTANGYTVTQLAPVAIIEHLLRHDVTAGSTTPALLMGKDFASRLPGSSEITVT
ncbi:MAG: saccharopine dehydrogenase family protein [Woeseiaceae bacterium]|jgi:short subunit dehydrogenase-like uncharacterized protein